MEASAVPRPHRLSPSPRLLRLAGDDRLVALIRSGNEAAFEVVYERYHRSLLSFSRHMLGNTEDAAEAVQQTFLSAYRDLTTSAKAIQLKAWLFTIARNRCLSVLRGRREHADIDVVEPATEGLAAEVQRREDLREMLGDLSRLPEDQRAALVLAEIGSLAHDEIGEIVGCSREKVKALVFQARSSLAASREARATSCQDIREQLATLRGGALRRTGLRRHLRDCPGCREFSQEVRRQRQAFAVILPVAPIAGLKEMVLSGAGIGGGGAAATTAGAGGGAAAGFGALGAKSLAVKALVGVVVLGGGTAGGIAVTGLAEGGDQVASGSGSVPSAHKAGAQIASVASQQVASARASDAVAVRLSPPSPSARGRSGGTPTAVHGRGRPPAPGASQKGKSNGSSQRHAGAPSGQRNGGGNGQRGKSEKSPSTIVSAPVQAPKPSAAPRPGSKLPLHRGESPRIRVRTRASTTAAGTVTATVITAARTDGVAA